MFWQEHRDVAMNERQVKVVNRLWDGFDGKLTTVKWAKVAREKTIVVRMDAYWQLFLVFKKYS